MQTGWRVGALFGIPLFLDPSWFVILLLLATANGLNWQQHYPEWGLGWIWGTGLAMALLLFASVLLHELGHSLVARAQGIPVNSITLFLFGGVAAIDQESKTPMQALQVAIAGPAVSLAICGSLWLGSQVLPPESPAQILTLNLARINLILALFNLIPGLPLDGGQVFKAIVWQLSGNRLQGVHWAAQAGMFLGWGAIAAGLAVNLIAQEFIPLTLWVALIGWFVARNAQNYDRLAYLQETLLNLPVSEAMQPPLPQVSADLTISEFTQQFLLQSDAADWYAVVRDNQYQGLISATDLQPIERSQWETVTLGAIAQTALSVQPETSLAQAIQLAESHQLSFLPVVNSAGAVVGVTTRTDWVQATVNKLKLPVATLQPMEAADEYPPGLPLDAIARAAVNA